MTGFTQGNLYSYSGGKDVFVVKYDSSGTKQWTRQFGAPSFSQKSPYNSSSQMVSSEDEGKKVLIDSTGHIYLTGNIQGGLDGNSNSGKKGIFLIKYKFTKTHFRHPKNTNLHIIPSPLVDGCSPNLQLIITKYTAAWPRTVV